MTGFVRVMVFLVLLVAFLVNVSNVALRVGHRRRARSDDSAAYPARPVAQLSTARR